MHSWVKNCESPLSYYWGSDPPKCLTTPLGIQSSYSDKYQQCSSRVLQLPNDACRNLAESRFREGTGSGTRKHIILADHWMFQTFALTASSASENWCTGTILQSLDTVDYGFLSMANRVSAWLSFSVWASNYWWCPSIDSLFCLVTWSYSTCVV